MVYVIAVHVFTGRSRRRRPEGSDSKYNVISGMRVGFFVLRPPVLIRSGSYRLTDSAKRDMKNFLALLRLFQR